MATASEHETIEFIEEAIDKAKSKGKNVPTFLSRGKEYYYKAINSVYLCGMWTMISGIVCLLASVIVTTINFSWHGYNQNTVYLITTFATIIVVSSIPIAIGYRLSRLNSTPTFTSFLLTLSLIYNILLFAGIAPLIALIFNILSLVRWHTYKDWFYNVRTK